MSSRHEKNTPPRRGTEAALRAARKPSVRLGRNRHHVHALARAPVARELHLAADERDQRVVLALADVAAGEHDRAALAHEDAAREHALPAELLHAEPFRIRVAAVLGRGLAFFVRHGLLTP